MTIKFEIPFPLHLSLTSNQIREIEDDIDKRIQGLTEQTGLLFELDDFSVKIIVKIKEVQK